MEFVLLTNGVTIGLVADNDDDDKSEGVEVAVISKDEVELKTLVVVSEDDVVASAGSNPNSEAHSSSVRVCIVAWAVSRIFRRNSFQLSGSSFFCG